jgi:hypothetical protein
MVGMEGYEPKEMLADGRPLGLIAGNGPLPLLFARQARGLGIPLVAVGHLGETQKELEGLVERMTWVTVGQLGALIQALREGRVDRVVMLGGIDKKRALRDLRLDDRAMKLLHKLAARGDDSLLGAVARELEEEGVHVLGSQDVLASWLAPVGPMTSRPLTHQEERDVRLGISLLAHLGPVDVGQTVVIREGVILAVEAIEGTDQAISRGGQLGGPGAVVVKGSKPQQDMRFDAPVVGLGTLRVMGRVEATVLAMEAGRTMLLDREELLEMAEREGISLVGWTRETDRG